MVPKPIPPIEREKSKPRRSCSASAAALLPAPVAVEIGVRARRATGARHVRDVLGRPRPRRLDHAGSNSANVPSARAACRAGAIASTWRVVTAPDAHADRSRIQLLDLTRDPHPLMRLTAAIRVVVTKNAAAEPAPESAHSHDRSNARNRRDSSASRRARARSTPAGRPAATRRSRLRPRARRALRATGRPPHMPRQTTRTHVRSARPPGQKTSEKVGRFSPRR